jgi:LmbE family N-acetylglucosaminyl deacetylase
LTNGDKGTQNRTMTPQELAKIRKQEELNSAAVLGVKSVDFLGVSDGVSLFLLLTLLRIL